MGSVGGGGSFECAVCLEVLHLPVRTPRGHVFLAQESYLFCCFDCSFDAQKKLKGCPHGAENFINLKTVFPPCNETTVCTENKAGIRCKKSVNP